MASTPDNLYVTYVDVDRDLLKIWGQRNRIGATYIERQLLQLLPEFNRTPCPGPNQIHKGMFCFAKYTDDNYYRARVLSRVLNDSVSVLFVDYGNKDVIKLSNIRIQEGIEVDVLVKMSEQAEEYYLARVAAPPIGWTKDIVSEIRRTVCYEEFFYQIVAQVGDQKILEMQFHNEDFSTYLLKKQLASPLSLPAQRQMILTYCCLVPSNMKPESPVRDIPRVAFSPSVPPPNMRSFRPSNVPNDGMMQMNYMKMGNPVNFSQPPPAAHFPPSRPITSALQQTNQNMSKNPHFSPGSMPINHGNVVHGNINSQQPINPTMNPLLSTQSKPIQMVKDSMESLSGNSNIIQLLAQQVKQYIAEDNAKSESETEKFPHHYLNSVLEVGSTYNVIISYIDDGPWSFSVQLLSSETELRKVMDELVSTELVPLKPPIILGHPCIASSALYGNLCRGVVVSISRSAVKVYFVDFGNTEDLPSSSIYELPPKFFKIRVLSQKFSLAGLQKVVYSDDIKKFFKEVVHDEFLVLRVASLEDDNLPTCELYLKDTNIKRILNEKIREQRSSAQEDLPKVGETENVVVTWVVSPQKFFVQLHKRDADLCALKKELCEIETKGQPLTYQQLRVGFKCACLYESDGNWYRALITSVDSENAITVFYVDYGNTETVNISRLRRVVSSALINEMSNQAIQCSLKGFEDKSFDQESANKLESLVLEKELQMTVVSSEQELLSVQLFDNGSDIATLLLTSTPPKLESLDTSSQAWSSPFSVSDSGHSSSEKQKQFNVGESREKKESNSFPDNRTRLKNSGGRPISNFQSFKIPVQSTPTKSKRRNEENWRSDADKDKYWEPKWREPKSNDQNAGKIRGFKQGRENDTRDNGNNTKDSNGNNNCNSKTEGFRQERGGRDERVSNGKSERNGGFKQDRIRDGLDNRRDNRKDNNRDGWDSRKDNNRDGWDSRKVSNRDGWDNRKVSNRDGWDSRKDSNRDGWDSRKDSNFGEKKFNENRNRRFDVGGGRRSERSGVREDRTDERKSTRKPIRREDLAPPGSKFEERIINLGSTERGIVTYYFSPHEFFIQSLVQEEEFKRMMSDIQTYYVDKYSLRDPVQAGDIVIAQFSLDKVLYRAEVVKSSPVTVRYVDYGNQEPVEQKGTWAVDKQFLKLPKQVIKCKLANIEPLGLDWPPPGGPADKFFELDEYKCTFLSVEGDMYEIALEDAKTGKDVAQELIAAGHARTVSQKLDVPKIEYSLLPKQLLRLYVSHVTSPSDFYVILNQKGVEVIENEVKTLAGDKKNLIPLNRAVMKPEMPCLCTNDDISWYRGHIVKTDGDKVLVWFSDRGNTVEVAPEKVMCLPDYLKVFQPQAVKCSLHNSSVIQNEEEFKEAVEFKHHLISILSATDEGISVVLYNEEGKKFDFQKCDDFPQTVDAISHLPIISQKLPIVISHMDSPGEVYIQRLADNDDLINLTERMNSFYAEEKEGFDIEEGGDVDGLIVAAKSVFYDCWYRGWLLSSKPDGLEVLYIDYGNKEVLPRESVKKLDPSLLNINAFTKKLSLGVRFNAENAEDINSKVLEVCQDKDVLGYFINVDGELIAEITVNGERITQILSLPVIEEDKFAGIFSSEKTKREARSAVEQPEEQPTAKVPEPDDLKVIVSHIDSPNRFWVYKESMSNELHQFQNKLQKSCEILPDKENVQVGDTVAAVFSDMWYRARVTNVDGDKLTVQFIDYGNTFIVDLSCNTVKELTDEFLRVPVFATPYALTGTWNQSSTSKFEEIMLENEEAVKVVVLEQSDPAIVDLYQNGRSIASMLKELVCAEEERDDLSSVYISHINSPNDFYVQKGSCEETIKNVNDRLRDAENFEDPSPVEEGKIYAAKFSDDEAWYRARAEKIDGDTVEILFLDYGNISSVSEIKCLPSDLVNIPNLAENYSLLYGENCDSWSEAACEKFAEFADGRKLKMEVVIDGIKKPVVKLFDEGKNISDELEALCEKDGRSEVYITHALSPTDFYIQYLNDEHYKAIADKLMNGDDGEDLKDRKPGTLCQARFVDDGYWYRAKILRELDEGVEVFFIDFGNTSIAVDLKKLPGEIEDIPPRAIRCSLNLPETNIPESVKEEFINLTEGGTCVFRARVITSDELSIVSLKLGGRILEETLNLDVNSDKNAFLPDTPNQEGFPHSVDCETDDGKNSKKNLMSENYLISNLADDLRSAECMSNETDEEKRVKIAISGIEGSDGFKSDDEKGIEGTSHLNATDNELMEEAREGEELETVSEDSALDTFEDIQEGEQDSEKLKMKESSGDTEVEQAIKRNGVSYHTERTVNDCGASPKSESEEVGVANIRKEGRRNKVQKIVPGSISRGEEEETLTETSPTQYRKLTFSEKLVPGSISRGVSLESMQSEQEHSPEESPERQTSQSAPNTPKFSRRNDTNSYIKIDASDRVVPGCISTGIPLHCSPVVEKVPATDKIVPGAVNGSCREG